MTLTYARPVMSIAIPKKANHVKAAMVREKLKIKYMTDCNFPLCKYPALNDFCIHHKKHFCKPEDKKEVKKIANLSAKRKELQKEYVKIVKGLLTENPNCQIKAPGCTVIMQGCHHVIKRSAKNLCDKANLIRACNSCNLYLENNDEWARENGFVKSKFSQVEKI